MADGLASGTDAVDGLVSETDATVSGLALGVQGTSDVMADKLSVGTGSMCDGSSTSSWPDEDSGGESAAS